jgi:flagellar biosynthesis GTPase FlhF
MRGVRERKHDCDSEHLMSMLIRGFNMPRLRYNSKAWWARSRAKRAKREAELEKKEKKKKQERAAKEKKAAAEKAKAEKTAAAEKAAAEKAKQDEAKPKEPAQAEIEVVDRQVRRQNPICPAHDLLMFDAAKNLARRLRRCGSLRGGVYRLVLEPRETHRHRDPRSEAAAAVYPDMILLETTPSEELPAARLGNSRCICAFDLKVTTGGRAGHTGPTREKARRKSEQDGTRFGGCLVLEVKDFQKGEWDDNVLAAVWYGAVTADALRWQW